MRNMNWIVFALLTVLSWGVYGVLLHNARGHGGELASLPWTPLLCLIHIMFAAHGITA